MIDKRRSFLIPVLQGVVWISSIGFSVFFDFGGAFPTLSVVRKLLLFVAISIFFELLLVLLDLKFALNGYVIDRDLAFRLQTFTIPFLICASCSIMPAFLFAGFPAVICLIVSCGCLKAGLLHSVCVVDNKKVEVFNIQTDLYD